MFQTVEDPETKERNPYFIEALARGFVVLDAFSTQRHELSLKDIATVTGVSPATALRIGYTLVQSGYLIRNPLTKGYRLGPKVVSVGMATLNSLTLPELAEPYLIELRNRTEEAVKLAVFADSMIILIARFPSLHHETRNRYVRREVPIYASALGRATLAYLPRNLAASLIEEASDVKLTPKTPTKAQTMRELATIRKRGYAINDRGVAIGDRSVAAPLLDTAGLAVGAISLSASPKRVSLADLEMRLAPCVVETADTIGSALRLNVPGAGWAAPLLLAG